MANIVGMGIIRVFPRRTSYTPTDAMAFVGDPPMMRPEAERVHISCTFSWDIPTAERLALAWGQYYPRVEIGGPAFGDPGNEFVPGMYVKHGVVFTSRGCPRRCPWCFVPEREGTLRLLSIKDGYKVQDNNLLACPHGHQEKVYEMLSRQRRGAVFAGGLDCRLIDEWVVEQLRRIRIAELFLAADTKGILRWLRKASEALGWLTRRQRRCFVLIGFNDESLSDAKERLEAVWQAGCLPFAQLYQGPEATIWSEQWRDLAREWSRPAAMFARHREL